MGRYKSYLTDVQNEGGGVEAPLGQCPKERRFFYGFPQRYQHGHKGYPVKEHEKTSSVKLDSYQLELSYRRYKHFSDFVIFTALFTKQKYFQAIFFKNGTSYGKTYKSLFLLDIVQKGPRPPPPHFGHPLGNFCIGPFWTTVR